jgi:sec-independent protein translocase protein TatB
MLSINGGEFVVLLLIAVIVIGPERLPEYSRQLRTWIVKGRDMLRDGRETLEREVGADVDWAKLDPRQYDPRTIVREALYEPASKPAQAARPAASIPLAAGTPAPFDAEAT